MKKGYHDYTPEVKIEKKEPKKYRTGDSSLRILEEIPKQPIGYLKDSHDQIIQITDEKGNINVDTYVLQFGNMAPKQDTVKRYDNPLTKYISKIYG
jgi:hypothetical protein